MARLKKGEDKAARGLSVVSVDDPALEEMIGEELHAQLMEDIELLDELGSDLDLECARG